MSITKLFALRPKAKKGTINQFSFEDQDKLRPPGRPQRACLHSILLTMIKLHRLV